MPGIAFGALCGESDGAHMCSGRGPSGLCGLKTLADRVEREPQAADKGVLQDSKAACSFNVSALVQLVS